VKIIIKNIILSCLTIFTLISCKNDIGIIDSAEVINDWYLISANNTDHYVDKIFFINPKIGWIIGNGGTILTTINGGNSWLNQKSNTSKNLTAIFFINENQGWITGLNNTFLYTFNGGNNWQQTNVYDDTKKHNTDIYFIDDKNGWFLNNYGKIFQTDDGGITWVFRNSIMNPLLIDIYFTDTDNRILAGSHFIYSTNDSGQKWSCCATLNETDLITDIYFYDNKDGCALCSNGNVYKNSH